MEPIKVLLVDDEYLALNLLEEFIGQLSGFEIINKLKSPVKALELLNEQSVDLLFLDIQMPMLSGNNLLKVVKTPPVTIFTTAYSEYAVEAFGLNAVDYLVKPFSFERFFQAVNKAKDQLRLRTPIPQVLSESVPIIESGFIMIRADGKMHKVFWDDIVYIEGLKEYAKIILTSGYLITFERMKNLEETLPVSRFLRVHKSFIIAKNKVKLLDGNRLEMINKVQIPISREKREEIVKDIFR
ncbi:LytTR family DNA-binding domain-containing protein [Cytophagaceae bacterium YF14B1]|uniref:LytTR family DNA-binding domain-containing protein n=1 Tax=Xanthocytophaga flava TaxID=3048013 RepID=A0AAE3UCA2_9BACT|nr:LytTR family DNA-binding domain-containing protein [Xanthocytophaga flavus]MDJ1484534.1 LytTR family DNA-binding domain-containing protein [Xanthocytophaga flavus]